MRIAVSPLFIFPPIAWWASIAGYEEVRLDVTEPFQKMTYRNRYHIATANGPLLLSVPLAGGRLQRIPMQKVQIDERQNWQKQHWRSLFSAYGRAPFFEHYGPSLEALLHQRYEHLAALNKAAIEWIKKELRLPQQFILISEAAEVSAPIKDLKAVAWDSLPVTHYTQVFEERTGFLPHLSILDMIMNEGPAAVGYMTAL